MIGDPSLFDGDGVEIDVATQTTSRCCARCDHWGTLVLSCATERWRYCGMPPAALSNASYLCDKYHRTRRLPPLSERIENDLEGNQ